MKRLILVLVLVVGIVGNQQREIDMASFEKAMEFVLENEIGRNVTGEVKVYKDSSTGEYNKYGVTLATVRLLSTLGNNKYGIEPTQAGIDKMTREQALAVYKDIYWDKMQLDKVEGQEAATKIMDAGVNMGIWPVVKMVQRVVGVNQDGNLRVKTLAGINGMDEEEFVTKFIAELEDRYEMLVYKKPVYQKYKAGWLARARRRVEK